MLVKIGSADDGDEIVAIFETDSGNLSSKIESIKVWNDKFMVDCDVTEQVRDSLRVAEGKTRHGLSPSWEEASLERLVEKLYIRAVEQSLIKQEKDHKDYDSFGY